MSAYPDGISVGAIGAVGTGTRHIFNLSARVTSAVVAVVGREQEGTPQRLKPLRMPALYEQFEEVI